jgi:fructan beta-fructosidase
MRHSSENPQLTRGLIVASELYRPQYHFSPQANWMNDPNGPVYCDGEYHLFYQYHPESPVWGLMHWGHAVSCDLIHWQHLPIALYPDEHGMIFSGSAVVDWNNAAGFGEKAMIIIFTYNKEHKETQNLAYSTDKGRTWTKYAGNPVIPHPNYLRDFRDPKVFWHENHWVMSLAAGDMILFYASPDLKHWEQSGSFGGGYGCTSGVWETPDLFKLPVDNGPETRWVLTVGVGNGGPAGGSGTQYFIGEFNEKKFTSENSKDTILWADYGADYYAPQSWSDEPNACRIMIGWMNNWQYATLIPTSGWRGTFSIIRELSLARTENGIRLIQKPISEMQTLQRKRYHWQEEVIQPETNLLANIRGESLEVVAEFQIINDVDCFGFRVRVGQGEHTTISYVVKDKTLRVDRTHSGRVDFKDSFAQIHSADILPINDVLRLHIFVDCSSVEVFANDGLVVFSECIFPSKQSQGLELFAEGGFVTLNSLDIYQHNPAKFYISRETILEERTCSRI